MTSDGYGVHYRQVDGLEISHVPDGWVIYHHEADRVHFLNPTAALVFGLCNGRHSVADIERILSGAFALSTSTTDQVCACIANLVDEGLVTQCLSSQS